MEKQFIISIGREFGSGGHEIAQKLAEHYGVQLLDHNLLDEVAAERHLDAKELKSYDEKRKNPFISRTVRGLSSAPEENVYLLQFDYLKKKAADGESFVIVGRCSENILKEYPCLITIFVLGDMEKKTERIMRLYHLTREDAVKLIHEKDAKRKRYHNSNCEGKWGDSRNYDLSVNSSKLGIEGTLKLLIQYIDHRKNE